MTSSSSSPSIIGNPFSKGSSLLFMTWTPMASSYFLDDYSSHMATIPSLGLLPHLGSFGSSFVSIDFTSFPKTPILSSLFDYHSTLN